MPSIFINFIFTLTTASDMSIALDTTSNMAVFSFENPCVTILDSNKSTLFSSLRTIFHLIAMREQINNTNIRAVPNAISDAKYEYDAIMRRREANSADRGASA